MSDNIERAKKHLAKARTLVLGKSPFIATLALSMRYTITDAVERAATNGLEVLINPDWFVKVPIEQAKFVVAHEALHPALDHCSPRRRGARNPGKWNRAADYVINDLLFQQKFELMSAEFGGCLHDASFRGMGTEEIYAKLPDDEGAGAGEGGIPGTGNDLRDAPSDQQGTVEQKVKEMVARAAQAARLSDEYGKLPDLLKRMVDDLLNPKVDWRTQLAQFLRDSDTSDYSFTRPNKRFMPQFYLPTLHSEGLRRIDGCFDTSGSIQKELKVFMSEFQGLREQLRPRQTRLMSCDADVHNIEEFDDQQTIAGYVPQGGGGTDFRPPFKEIEESGVDPTCFLYFTDGYGTFPAEPPAYPVLWVMTTDVVPPWGQHIRVMVDEDE